MGNNYYYYYYYYYYSSKITVVLAMFIKLFIVVLSGYTKRDCRLLSCPIVNVRFLTCVGPDPNIIDVFCASLYNY